MNYSTRKKSSAGKKLPIFLSGNSQKLQFKWEILPTDDLNQGIFPQIRALFSNFWKEAGETSPSSPSCYAPALMEKLLCCFIIVIFCLLSFFFSFFEIVLGIFILKIMYVKFIFVDSSYKGEETSIEGVL